MVGSYFVGAHVLNFFGVSLPVVQIGGGLVVVSIILAALIAMTAVAISILLCYGLADQLARVIGKTGGSRPSTHIVRTTRNSALPLSIRA